MKCGADFCQQPRPFPCHSILEENLLPSHPSILTNEPKCAFWIAEAHTFSPRVGRGAKSHRVSSDLEKDTRGFRNKSYYGNSHWVWAGQSREAGVVLGTLSSPSRPLKRFVRWQLGLAGDSRTGAHQPRVRHLWLTIGAFPCHLCGRARGCFSICLVSIRKDNNHKSTLAEFRVPGAL